MSAMAYVRSGHSIDIAETKLRCTCSAAPEQYDVFLANQQIGYLRLRWGEFFAAYPGLGGEIVYEALIEDKASSFSDEERGEHLPKAVDALLARYRCG